VLRENCLDTMQIALQCNHPDFKIPPELESDRDAVLNAAELSEVVPNIETLANSEFIKNAFQDRGRFRIQIPCVSQYYWSNAQRFANADFNPGIDDILRSRIKTSGIQTLDFVVSDIKFTIVDVGGQRSERRKWLHCFDDVTAIIFLSAIDEYDMFLEEDDDVSRLTESLALWSEVTGSQFFKPHSWILFLNKYDSLRQKISQKSLHNYFEDISETDGQDFDKCVEYITQKYDDVYNGSSPFYSYVTCAIDTTSCQKVFDTVRDIIINKALCRLDLM